MGVRYDPHGSTHNNSIWKSFSSAVKLPLMFLLTLFICAPTLYLFDALFVSCQTIENIPSGLPIPPDAGEPPSP
jgi:hypothetical protein